MYFEMRRRRQFVATVAALFLDITFSGMIV